jgi:hypothetical protein
MFPWHSPTPSSTHGLPVSTNNSIVSDRIQSLTLGIAGILIALASLYLAYLQLKRHYHSRLCGTTPIGIEPSVPAQTSTELTLHTQIVEDSNTIISLGDFEGQAPRLPYELEA